MAGDTQFEQAVEGKNEARIGGRIKSAIGATPENCHIRQQHVRTGPWEEKEGGLGTRRVSGRQDAGRACRVEAAAGTVRQSDVISFWKRRNNKIQQTNRGFASVLEQPIWTGTGAG